MTRKHRPSSSESASYSPATSRKHRRRTPRQKKAVEEEDDEEEEDYNNDDADASDSQYNDESQGDEYEQFEEEAEAEEEEDDDDDAGSESVSNAPPDDPSFSQQSHSYVPESSNNIENKNPSKSASHFLNLSQSQPMINASSSYVKIAPLPTFRGTPSESPVTHLSRFNKVCRANNASSIDMQMKIFPVTLEEEAALWYDLNIEPYYTSLSWDEIKLSFLQAYYKFEHVEELRSELMGIHQGENERVRSYFLRLQWILKRWPEHGLHDNVLKGVFVDGLREEFHDWVLIQKPNSLNDALRLAFSFEELRSIRGTKGMVVPTCGFCEVSEGMRELWREIKQKEGSDKGAKDLVMGETSSGQGKIETDEGEKGGEAVVGSVKKNQCQCTKHQCWKKNLLRNSSLESRISRND